MLYMHSHTCTCTVTHVRPHTGAGTCTHTQETKKAKQKLKTEDGTRLPFLPVLPGYSLLRAGSILWFLQSAHYLLTKMDLID